MVERMRATANWVCLHRDVHSKRVTPVNKASKAITIRALNCTGFAGGVFLCVRRRSRALVAQRFPKTNWVCFVAGLLRTHVCPMRHVDRCHPPHLRFQRQTTRRVRPGGRIRTSEGKLGLFCETLVRSTSMPEAFRVQAGGYRCDWKGRTADLGADASSKRYAV